MPGKSEAAGAPRKHTAAGSHTSSGHDWMLPQNSTGLGETAAEVTSDTEMSKERKGKVTDGRIKHTSSRTTMTSPMQESQAKTQAHQPNHPRPKARMSEHSGLHLTGRIISASFTIPYCLSRQRGGPWELTRRPGTAALYDSFAYLASPKSGFKEHVQVGWTGEIEEHVPVNAQPFSSTEGAPPAAYRGLPPPLNTLSAPVPLDKGAVPLVSQTESGIHVSKPDRDALQHVLRDTRYGRVLPIFLSDPIEHPDDDMHLQDQGRWRRYAERILYPTLHYKPDGPTLDGASDKKFWSDYLHLNKLFAERILAEYQPGDVVSIHDYQLFLLPAMLRAKVPDIYIGFYNHCPFPSSEFVRSLSMRKNLLHGILGSNMVGFQNYSYARHFASCCARILGSESSPAGVDAHGAHVAVDVFPIGIDVDNVRRLAFESAETEKVVEGMKARYAGKKIIVGRDRLDSIRGVSLKLSAFERLLEQYPEWRDKVVLIQVTSPTSFEEGSDKHRLSNEVSHLVSRINGRYGTLSFSPVKHYPQHLTETDYFALLRMADVALITSIRDGMNTTSLEHIVCQHEKKGPLILSEFSGTASNLKSAIHINPWDAGGVADAINDALTMDTEERAKQHEEMYRFVISNPVTTWCDKFIDRLLDNLTSFNQSIATPALNVQNLNYHYQRSKRRLFMFDYDGTLTPIVKDPQAAVPSDRILRTIKTLAADPRNAVWIISGRDQAFLNEWMGHIPELGLSAEHGSFVCEPSSEDWENLTELADMRWQSEVMDIFTHFTERTPGSFIERKRVALTWHYRRVDPEYGAFQASECRRLLESTVAQRWPVEVMLGKANLEVRPTFVNKGCIAQRLLNGYKQYHEHSDYGPGPDFILCMGDDFTDEDMFRTLSEAPLNPETVFTVTVGASSKQTLAKYHVLEPSDVISTVAFLNNRKNGLTPPTTTTTGGIPAAISTAIPTATITSDGNDGREKNTKQRL